MARDPETRHETAELCKGLRRVGADDDLSDNEALRAELLHLGLLLVDHAGGLHLTNDGRKFLVEPA